MKGMLCQAEMVKLYPEDNGKPLAVFGYFRKTTMAKV